MDQTAPETADIPCELIPKPALYLLEAKLPSALFDEPNWY